MVAKRLRPLVRRAAPAPGAPSARTVEPKCTSRPHLEQFSDHVSSSRSRSAPHLQELEPEHLRVDRNRMIASTGSGRLIDQLPGFRGLLGDCVDGVLKDLPLAACHGGRQHGSRSFPSAVLAHLTRDISMVAMYETSPMVRIHPRSVLRRT